MDLVYSTTMLSQGGRGGQMQSDDGGFKLKLSVPPRWAAPPTPPLAPTPRC